MDLFLIEALQQEQESQIKMHRPLSIMTLADAIPQLPSFTILNDNVYVDVVF